MFTLRTMTSRWLAGLLVSGLVLTAGPGASPARAGALERELLDHASEVLQYLRQHGYRSVGVLKFRVKKDNTVTDNAGPLTLNIARQLESVLLNRYDLHDDRALLLLHDASFTAAEVPGAN